MQQAFAAPGGAEEGAALFTTGFGPGARRAFRASYPAMRAFLRWRYFEDSFVKALASVTLGGVIIAGVSAALGSAAS